MFVDGEKRAKTRSYNLCISKSAHIAAKQYRVRNNHNLSIVAAVAAEFARFIDYKRDRVTQSEEELTFVATRGVVIVNKTTHHEVSQSDDRVV